MRKRRRTFRKYSFEVEVLYEDRYLMVEGEAYPYVPARRNCLPEDARPAEGGEAEDLVISIFRTTKKGVIKRTLCAGLTEGLQEDDNFMDAFYVALNEVGADGPDS